MGQVQSLGRSSGIYTSIKYTDPAVERHPEKTFSGLIWLKGLGILLRIALSFLQRSLPLLPGRLSFAKARPWYRLRHPFPMLKWKMEHSRPLAIEMLSLSDSFSSQVDVNRVKGSDIFATSPTYPLSSKPPQTDVSRSWELPWRTYMPVDGRTDDQNLNMSQVKGILSKQWCELVYKRSKRVEDPCRSLDERRRRC